MATKTFFVTVMMTVEANDGGDASDRTLDFLDRAQEETRSDEAYILNYYVANTEEN